jgi:hypothetical protein
MTLTIALPPETEKKLLACAAANGQDIASFALQAIEEKLGSHARPPANDVLAPLRQEFRDDGTSDEQLFGLLTQARDEVRRAKRGPRAP